MYKGNEGNADEVYKYCHETFDPLTMRRDGVFAKPSGKMAARVFRVGSKGRAMLSISIKGRKYLAHRVVWLIMTGQWPAGNIEFIDGNGLNCNPDNLKLAKQKTEETA